MSTNNAENVVKVLRYMKRLLRKGWAQGFFAYTAKGRMVNAESRHAAKFCLLGARQRAVHDLEITDGGKAISLVARCAGVKPFNVASYNDKKTRTKADILKTVDCAIKKAEAAQ